MNERVKKIADQIAALEVELLTALQETENRVFFEIRGKRVEFEKSVKTAHEKMKSNVFRWLVTNRPRNLITGPIIYGMVFPLLILDLCVSTYHWTCFPVYGIKKVTRADYIVFDRHHLKYLNFFQRLHCNYCEYANGLVAYWREILGRTEEYFCPIKHARKLLGTHARYRHFLEYGQAEDYDAKVEAFRVGLSKTK